MTDEDKQPRVVASLSLEPTLHSFSSPRAPNLNLTLTLDHDKPITIYADDLAPSLMIACGAFTIYDLETGIEVKQAKRTHCRIPPPSKVQVDVNENLFHTLYPLTPLTLLAPFTRELRDGEKPPRACGDPEYSGRHGSCGVDGLEIDHQYIMTLASNPRILWHHVRWWEYGTKEEILGAGGLDARVVKFRPGPHKPIEVDTSETRPVDFGCVS